MNPPLLKEPGTAAGSAPTKEAAERRRLRDRAGQSLLLAVIMFSSLGLYLAVLRWRGGAPVFVTHLALDDLVPFRPEWVWVYLLPYLVGPVVIGLLSRDTFRWFVYRGLALVGLTLVIFILWPTQTGPRPAATDLDGFTGWMYHQMVEIDEPPANAAPSLHVSLTCLLVLALVRDFPRWWLLSAAGVGLVWLSTLLTRQHTLIDVATGVLLAGAVVLAWPGRWRRKASPRSPAAGQQEPRPDLVANHPPAWQPGSHCPPRC
jgi:membrane-associated phospholipid phosphatase